MQSIAEVTKDEKWDLEIKPQESLFNLHIKDVWEYRDLLMLLVKRDFVSFYKQTILGPLWFFIQPAVTTVMYTFIFGNLAGIKTDDLPAPLFFMAGITAFNYFSDCLTKTSSVFKDNANIFGKVYFPRLIMPLSIVVSNLVRFGVQLLLFVLVMIVFSFTNHSFSPNLYILLFPVLVLLMAALGLGLGMIISAMTTKYRDLAFLVAFLVPLSQYATTVVYPLSEAKLKLGDYSVLISINPMTPIIEAFRYGFLGAGDFSWNALAYSFVSTITLLFVGIIVFNRVEKNFVDTV